MVIGIDASRANLKQRTGVEWYGYHVIRELARLDRTTAYRLYVWDSLRDELANLPSNFQEVIVPSRRLWPYTSLAAELKRNPVERLFIPSHLVPRHHPEATFVTIHDLGFRHFRENYGWYQYLSLWLGTRLSAKWASTIIVPSQAVASDVIKSYELKAEKVRIVPNGYDPRPFASIEPARVAEIMKHHRVQDPYLLYTGRLESRKNVARIIEAFYRLADSGLFGGQLVLMGNPGVGFEQIRDLVGKQRRTDQVVLTGYVPEEERAALMVGARIFVFPSLYEGFGIPVLEAFAAGTPVITGNRGALGEVARDAALTVDPENVEEIHDGMRRILSDESLGQALSARGRERLPEYSWERTATSIHEIITGWRQPTFLAWRLPA